MTCLHRKNYNNKYDVISNLICKIKIAYNVAYWLMYQTMILPQVGEMLLRASIDGRLAYKCKQFVILAIFFETISRINDK